MKQALLKLGKARYRLAIIIAATLLVSTGVTGLLAAQPSISNIPAYGILEPSGCQYFKGTVALRFDMYLLPTSSHYELYRLYIPDWDSEEARAAYPGEVDPKTGLPIDPEDYAKWVESLPHIWVDSPFHSHFVYFNTSIADEDIKIKLAAITEYFYAFYLYCWENERVFISEWQKVPKEDGTAREPFDIGSESIMSCETKIDDIIARADEFDTRILAEEDVPSPELNIGTKGTIDIGAGAVDRATTLGGGYTYIDTTNPANDTGTIDTFEIWANSDLQDTKVGTFYGSGTDYTNRDGETIGSVASGAKRTFTGLDTDVTSGDFAGIYYSIGDIERDFIGGSGYYRLADDQFGTGEQTYVLWGADDPLSFYGTGTESGAAGHSHSWGAIIG